MRTRKLLFVALAVAALMAPTAADARNGRIAAGIIGGLAAGALIGAATGGYGPYYYGYPAPAYYYPPAPYPYYAPPRYYAYPACYRRSVWTGRRWRRVVVCD